MNRKWLPHGITAGTLVVFIVLGLACASEPPPSSPPPPPPPLPRNPVTQSLYNDIGQDTFSQFRFYISKDIVLTRVDRNVSTDEKATVVTTNIQRNIVNLESQTAGRVQGTPTQDKLDIGFEKLEDGTIPTFTFVQKNEKGDDKYYFEQDTNGDISYAGEYYTITYQGQDEPYLLYTSDVKDTTNQRRMSGLE